jgi:hypothetical protein
MSKEDFYSLLRLAGFIALICLGTFGYSVLVTLAKQKGWTP